MVGPIGEEPEVIGPTTAAERRLIITSLRSLLSAEDDPTEIEQLKLLIDRLEDRSVLPSASGGL